MHIIALQGACKMSDKSSSKLFPCSQYFNWNCCVVDSWCTCIFVWWFSKWNCYCMHCCLVVYLLLPPPDPSLTPDNILQSTRNIPLWDSEKSYGCLNMPHSLHDKITAKYNGEQAKRELFSTWLTSHPCPTWEHVARLLRWLESIGKGKKGAAEEVNETYLKSEL